MASPARTKPELVIFDCDGVLVDSEPITLRTMIELCAPLGLHMDLPEALHLFRGGHMGAVVAEVERRIGGRVPEDFVATFRTRLNTALDSEVEAVDGIHDALEAIDVPICVASNGPREKMRTTLGRTGLLAHFEGHVYSAYDRGHFKPDPDLFLHAAATEGTSPERCVVVEDSLNGIRAARAAGMRALAYVPRRDAAALTALGAEHLSDMRALPTLMGMGHARRG